MLYFHIYIMDRIERHKKTKSKNGKYVYSSKYIRQQETLQQKSQSQNYQVKKDK